MVIFSCLTSGPQHFFPHRLGGCCCLVTIYSFNLLSIVYFGGVFIYTLTTTGITLWLVVSKVVVKSIRPVSQSVKCGSHIYYTTKKRPKVCHPTKWNQLSCDFCKMSLPYSILKSSLFSHILRRPSVINTLSLWICCVFPWISIRPQSTPLTNFLPYDRYHRKLSFGARHVMSIKRKAVWNYCF